MSKQRLLAEAALRRLDLSIHVTRTALAPLDGAREAYDHLLDAVRSRTPILARRTAGRGNPDVNRALAAMALYCADWLRPLTAWCPPAGSAWPVLASLAEYLFAQFALPRFLASVWRDGEGEVARLPQHTWYLRLARGENVRRIGLPMPLTRAMAHRFLQAPDHLSFIGALRWAQVVTLGGSEALVRAVLATRLGHQLEHEEAWSEVVRFFVQHAELPLAQIGPIVDFIQHQRFEVRHGVAPDGTACSLPPPRPDLSLRGRTPASLLRLVDAWHSSLGTVAGPDLAWPRAPIGELVQIERAPAAQTPDDSPASEPRVWTISELCSSHALRAEGLAMQHCVATYARDCVQGRSSIWALQLETAQCRIRRVTIEVRLPTRRIVQARRKRNASPSVAERALIAQWAAREGLIVGAEAYPA